MRDVLHGTLLALMFASLPLRAAQAAGQRDNLWNVEQICLASEAATGLPFPCLSVDIQRGFIVLRPPYGKADTILTPAVPISGIEAPELLGDALPNYFSLAWAARSFLTGKTERALKADDVGLAVNSSLTRSQDQLHIHIDCLAADVKERLADMEPRLPQTGWIRVARPIRGLDFWARRIARPALSDANPFALVARGVPDAKADMGAMTVVLAGSTSRGGVEGFLLLAANVRQGKRRARATGEDLLDHNCRP